METPPHTFSIDIDQVIASKSRKLAKYTPKFLTAYLKRTIHQDEINRLLAANRDSTGAEFAVNILRDLNVSCRVKFIDKEALDTGGRYIFASNHPLGGLDGLILISELGKTFGGIKFVVNDLLMNIKPLEPLFVPVNKHGKMNREYLRLINAAYASSDQILYFPAGLCSRLIKGTITDLPWQPSFVKQALRYERSIVPVYFSGRNSDFFYRLAKFRKFLGIKFNLEMLYLPDEMFRQKNTTFDVVIGKPVPVGDLKGKNPAEWCGIIREKAYSLKQYIYGTDHPANRQGSADERAHQR